MFYCCFFLCPFWFFRHEIAKLPWPIAVKLCHMIAIWVRSIMQVQKIGDPPPKQIGGPKHAKFWPISYNFRLQSRISPDRVKISKIGNVLIENDSSRIIRKKSGELWSTNYRVLDVSLDPPKWNFSADYISALTGWWPLKFLHALQIDQGLLA